MPDSTRKSKAVSRNWAALKTRSLQASRTQQAIWRDDQGFVIKLSDVKVLIENVFCNVSA